ncbi:dpy-30 motif protein [Cystoisospora suis]|uniref:Dpy-30 motif protein n=1 Tax=Cystoisospora suis TaxID=483139 RepID=A0A2C6KLX4_9APIC|nr:dpy-30 motif protein [Cystoisospora suis]
MEKATATKAGARTESSGLPGGRANLNSSQPTAEQQPTRILHIDADNAVVLATRFARQGTARRDSSGLQEQEEFPMEACCAKDFASNLLAEFMWGTLDAETGQWKPVSEVPSCDPPDDDDSLVTYGQFLRTRHTAPDPDDPQVCENIRRALQTFGQAGSNKQGTQRSNRHRQQNDGNATQADKAKAANPEDVLKSVHTQLMKRITLPLTVRLGMNCETPNPEEVLAQVPVSSDDRAGEPGDSPTPERQLSTDRTEVSGSGSALLANLSGTSEARSEPTPDADEGLYRARMKQGYWYTMPYLFHTLFTWIKQRVAFKLVFYTRDHIGGKHISSLVREFNDLCEGRHPAFDGENRTKQVFLDGRKKSTPDLRISPCQIGCVSISTAGSAAASSPADEVPQRTQYPTQEIAECTEGQLERQRVAWGRLQSFWTADFPTEGLRYQGIQEIYAGVTHDLLSRHSVVCLCFGTPPTPRKCTPPSQENSTTSSPERTDNHPASETVPAEHTEEVSSSPAVSRSRRGSLRRASHASATAKGPDETTASERSPGSRSASSADAGGTPQGSLAAPSIAGTDVVRQSISCQRTTVKFSLADPLTPLPVLVDPADFTLFHVCLSSPSVPSVQEGLVCVPTMNVVEAVLGSALFYSGRAMNPAAVLPAIPGASTSTVESQWMITEALGQGENPGACEGAPALGPTGMLRARVTVDIVYTVLIPEPCSLLCNPDYVCNLVEESLSQRRRMMGQTDPLSADWRPISLWSSGASSLASAEVDSSPGASAARSGQSKNRGCDSPDVPAPERPKPRFLKALDPFAGLSAEEIKALPTREYLRATVIPVLLPAIEEISKDRPENPLAWIAFYLLRHATHFNRTVRVTPPQMPWGLMDSSRPQSPRGGQGSTAKTGAATNPLVSETPGKKQAAGVNDERL